MLCESKGNLGVSIRWNGIHLFLGVKETLGAIRTASRAFIQGCSDHPSKYCILQNIALLHLPVMQISARFCCNTTSDQKWACFPQRRHILCSGLSFWLSHIYVALDLKDRHILYPQGVTLPTPLAWADLTSPEYSHLFRKAMGRS